MTLRLSSSTYIAVLLLLLVSCTKNETKNFPDQQDPGLAIFSNTQNNIMTCYADGKAWQTRKRIVSTYFFGGGTDYEVYVFKQTTGGIYDQLSIEWNGSYKDNPNGLESNINLVLQVPPDFTYKDFSSLEGRRFTIDTTNEYFSSSIEGFQQIVKGSGNIFFLTARLDSISPSFYKGSISGLFEAAFDNKTITRGRFDHFISSLENVFFQ